MTELGSADMDVLVATDLRREFGERTAVDGVGFTIAAGETYGLLGPNGAGKTTTISMVCGLLEPDAGSVRVHGEKMQTERCSAKGHLGLVPQDLALYEDLSGRENLDFFGRLQGLTGDVLTRRTAEVLDLVGLTDRADERVQEYSGGMKRRCNIGAALLHEPELLILDEPTVGVDPQSRNAILSGIADLQAAGMAVLYTTHYMEEAERLCDRIGVMDEGRLVAEGSTAELVSLVGEHPVLRLNGDGDMPHLEARVSVLDGVVKATVCEGRLDVIADNAGPVLGDVLRHADEAGVRVTGVSVDEPDLEDVFLHLTGKALRD
ncbi:MAG: ABC transporter ATP-binding protein [Microthrixaceae bacterium]